MYPLPDNFDMRGDVGHAWERGGPLARPTIKATQTLEKERRRCRSTQALPDNFDMRGGRRTI